MKLLASSIVLIACCSALAQDLPPSYNSKTFSVLDMSKNVVLAFYGNSPGSRVLFIRAAKDASGVTGGTRAASVFENGSLILVVPSSTSAEMNKADSVQGARDLVQLRGNVEVHTTGTLVQADEVDYHLSTGQMELRGNVRLTPVTQ